ncbi:GGDEF domain-containing protein [Hyalangium rubrum]|uniref:diguanylate cyclase n=1 Tax=Hyalangium rubrum TaxID=3103134 RepID=A0ABU5GUE3_9BACT|nr:diguanylate cyclase [Hyalangium sp. s54d21]MDY7224796.1 diguanylate cyclase [Hyalangium sp. s54d21]
MALGPHTVGRKLLWSIALPGLIIALLGAGYFFREMRRAVQDAAHREALALAEFVASTFTLPQADRAHPHGAVAEVLAQDSRLLRSVAELRVLTPDGRIRWSRRRGEEGSVHPESARLTTPTPERARSGREGTEVVRPLGGAECTGCHTGEAAYRMGTLQVRLSEPLLSRQLSGVFHVTLVATLLFGGLLTLATAFALHFFLTRPLRRLTNLMRRAEEGEFLVRAETRGTDELSRLSAAFNQMLARLTSMKVEEIDTHRDLAITKDKLALKEKLEERITELSLLFDIAHSLNSTLELSELFERVTRLVVERLKIPNFSVMLVNADGLLEIKSAWPQHRGNEGLTFAMGEGACGRAAESLRAVYLPDVEDRGSGFARRNLVGGTDHGSLLAVPMVHMDTLLGVMNFQRPEVAGFSPEELELLTAVADQAATAVKNARLHAETVQLTMTDPLTGAPNRRHLFSRLELELARAERYGNPLSVLMVDVDHFKKLNDGAGHRTGDEALRKVCDVLRSRVRKVDTLARYGGEEFMVLLPQTDKAAAVEVGEKLRRAVLEATSLASATQPGGHITISIGVSSFPVDATDQDTLVDCADSALYGSKRGGRNKVTPYEPGMEIHPGRERGPHSSRPANEPARPLPPPGVAKA